MTLTRSAPAVRSRETGAAAGSRYRRDIEGLRAVAVLLVVLYHCGVTLLPGGFVGVDVFFVISGYLITGLLLRELRTRGTISITGFYGRRVLRLLPAASLVIVTTVLASAWWLPAGRRQSVLFDAFHTMGYAINFRLAVVGADYLNADSVPSPLQHFWSLAVEEQFYLLWPPMLLAITLIGRPAVSRLRTALLAIVIGSFLLSVWQTTANPLWAYFGPHTRAWELGVGALLAFAPLERLRPRAARALGGAGLLAVLAAAVLFSATTAFPGSAALLPVSGAAAIIAGGVSAPSRLLVTAAMQAIGRLSYSWYLWHWPALTLAPFVLGHDLAGWQKLGVAAGAFGAAALTYGLIENPARNLRKLRQTPWRAIAAGAATTSVAAGICLIAVPLLGTAVAAQQPVYQARQLVPGPFDLSQLPAVVAASANAPAVPTNLVPPLDKAQADQPQVYRDGCSASALVSEVMTPCEYGDLSSPTTVVLTGDSHATHWFPALEAIAKHRHWRLVMVVKGACTVADQLTFLPQLKRNFTECATFRRAAWQRIRALRPAAVVMVSIANGGRLSPADNLTSSPDRDRLWTTAWMRSVDAIGSSGAKLFYINDTPYFAHNTPDCLSTHLDNPRYCADTAAKVVQVPERRRDIAEAMRARGVTVIDPLPWFCTATDCPMVIGNVLAYRDGHHITTVYSRLVAPLLARQLTLDGS